MFANSGVKALWARTKPMIWDGPYWMVGFAPSTWSRVTAILSEVEGEQHYCSVIRDGYEIAAILPACVWDRHRERAEHRDEYGPLACITFDVPLEIEVFGYLAPVVAAMAEAGVSVVPQCTLVFDHLLIHQRDADRAVRIIEGLQEIAMR